MTPTKAQSGIQRTWEERLHLLRAFGDDPNGYAVLQPKLHYVDTQGGFMAGRYAFGRFIGLNDPVAARHTRRDVLHAVIERNPKAVFMNLSEDAAQTLHAMNQGYRFHPFGAEHWLSLGEEPELTRNIRGALKKARKAGFFLREFFPDQVDDDEWGTLTAINQEFLDRTPLGREITFICRPVEFLNQPGVRFFGLFERQDGEGLFGFIVADPWFIEGHRVGYQLNAIRFRRTRIWGVYFIVVHHLLELFRREGAKRFSLGGVAFHKIDEESLVPHDARMRRRLAFIRNHGDRFYQLSHFTSMKLEIPGKTIRRFMAIPPTASVTRSILRYLHVSELF